jgi:hypothetical protein
MPGVAILRLHQLETIPSLEFKVGSYTHSTMTKATHNKDTIIALSTLLIEWDEMLWAKRIENSDIDIYTSNKELYEKLLTDFSSLVIVCYAPNERDLSILENTGSIIAKKLPHDKYHYKAFLLPHKIKSKEDKQLYLNWIEGQGTRILISNTVKEWFIKTEWNWDRRYLLVEDEQTLLMLKLRNSEAIGRVYDYVISDK